MAMISAIKLDETDAYITDIVTASSAAGYLERGGLVSKYYARRLRSQIENEFTDFSAKIDAGRIDSKQQQLNFSQFRIQASNYTYAYMGRTIEDLILLTLKVAE